MSEKLQSKVTNFVDHGTFKHVSLLMQQAEEVIFQGDFQSPLKPSFGSLSPIYLVASLTKPVLAMGLLKLVEDGDIALHQRVADFLPAFKPDGRIQITMRHLLCHTSGLPDLPPDNVELRRKEASLAAFLDQAASLPLEFLPGKSSRYSSLGYMVLAAIIELVTKLKVPAYLNKIFFQPLGMHDTSLGLPADVPTQQRFLERLVPVDMTAFDIEKFGNWNSNYWRNLSAPWGGMFSTTHDLSRFCQMIYQQGYFAGQQLLSPNTVKSAMNNQHDFYPELPLETQSRPWGLGWRLNWVTHRQAFSEILPTTVIGHYGATGSLMWINPESQTSFVLLTSTPQERAQQEMIKISNLAAAMCY